MSLTYNQPVTSGKVGGRGTLNYVPKWTPDGATLGNSQIFDDGTNVGVSTILPAYKFTVQTVTGNFGVAHTDGIRTQGSFVSDGIGGFGSYGTISNHSFGIFTNGVTKLFLATDGSFGINTAGFTPTAKLQVIGSGATSATFLAKFENSAAAEALYIRDDLRVTMGANFTWTPTSGLKVVNAIAVGSLGTLGTYNFFASESILAVAASNLTVARIESGSIATSGATNTVIALSVSGSNSSTGSATNPVSISIDVTNNIGTTLVSSSKAFVAVRAKTASAASHTNIANDAILFLAQTPTRVGGVITTNYAHYIENQGLIATTTSYGIYIAAQSGSATNYGIYSLASIALIDANIILSTVTGSIIATAVGQKFAFHGSTPVIQRAGAAQALVITTAATNVTPFGYATAAQADAIVTLVNEVRSALVEKGLIKGAA